MFNSLETTNRPYGLGTITGRVGILDDSGNYKADFGITPRERGDFIK